MNLAQAQGRLAAGLADAAAHGEAVVRIIHGRGMHSEYFPVLKSAVRKWLEESEFARRQIAAVFRGEDGSPYTRPNAGETVVVLRGAPGAAPRELTWQEEEEREARRHSKAMRAERRHKQRR